MPSWPTASAWNCEVITMTAYLVRRGSKFLHMDPKNGIFWGKKTGAFHFFSQDAAAQVSCGLTSSKAKITIEECEEE